jgi:hypothetical protein
VKISPLDWLHVVRNTIDYPLRQLFRWRRRGYVIQNENKDGLFSDLPAEQRLAAWQQVQGKVTRYRLEPLYLNSSVELFLKNLYYLDMLEKGLADHAAQWGQVLYAADIGASDWFYAPALAAFLRQAGTITRARQLRLDGYETDAYRVYADFYSRYDHTMAHINGLDEVTYIPQAFQEKHKMFQVVTQFFPFVFAHDHLEWGLPGGLFQPEAVLQAAWNSLVPGGVLLIVNQGEEEHHAQRRMMQAAGMVVEKAARVESIYYRYDIPHFLLTAQKP